jgi:hypothetical protein
MFWPTERAKPKSFGVTTVMFDSFIEKENIVIRKFIVSSSIVSTSFKDVFEKQFEDAYAEKI